MSTERKSQDRTVVDDDAVVREGHRRLLEWHGASR